MQNPQLQYYQAQARFAQLAHVQAQQQMLKYAQLQAAQAQAIATATAAQLAMQQAAFANSTSGRCTPCIPSAFGQVSIKRTAIHGDVKLCELGELSKLLLVWGTTDLTVLAKEFGSFSPMSIGLVYPAKSKGSCALIKFNTINEAMNAKANLPLAQFVIHYAHQPITITARSSKARRASAATAASTEIARAVKSGLQLEDFDSDTPAEWGSSRPPAMSRSGVSTPSSFSASHSAFTTPGASSFTSPGTSSPASPYLRGMTSPHQPIPTASFTPTALYLQQQQQLHFLQQQLQKQASAPPSPSEAVAVAGAPSTAAFTATKPIVEEKTTTTLSELVAADTTSESSEEGSSSDETSSTISEESTTVPGEASTPTRRTRKKKTKSDSSRSSRAASWRSSRTAVAPRAQVAKGPVKGSIGFASRKARMAKAPRVNSWSRPLQTKAPFEKTVVADLGGIALD